MNLGRKQTERQRRFQADNLIKYVISQSVHTRDLTV